MTQSSNEASDVPVCACGCGTPLRVRFVQGHDARFTSQLIADARQGAITRTKAISIARYYSDGLATKVEHALRTRGGQK